VKAFVFEGPRKLSLAYLPEPEPGPHEVVVRTKACGVCGTDHHILEGTFIASYPVVGGHEFAGEVAALGRGVAGLQLGQRVAVDPVLPCRMCCFCRVGKFNQCVSLGALGVTLPGGFAECVKAPETNVYPIGELPCEEAAFVEPLACVLWGVRRAGVEPGASVLIFGAGPIGLLLLQSIRRCGAGHLTVVDLNRERLVLAETLGASRTLCCPSDEELRSARPQGFELVVDATGVPAVVERGLKFTSPGGKFLVFGVCPPDGRISLSPFDVYRRDITIVGAFSLNQTFEPALRLIQSGAVSVRPLLSHRFPLEKLPDALGLVGRSGASMKVQIQFP